MADRPAGFRALVEHRVRTLDPLMKEAEEADRVFTKGRRDASAWRHRAYWHSEAYEITRKVWSECIDRVLASTGMVELIEALRTRRASDEQLATAMAYLRIKRRHFRSGYNREKICRHLRKAALTEEQKEVLREIVIEQLGYADREFSEIKRLVPRLASPEFERRIRDHDDKGRHYVRDRIRRIVENYFSKVNP